MSTPLPPSVAQGTSTCPYLIRALHEWCTDNGFTPYVAVFVGQGVRVPQEYVKNNEIVLNIAFEATTGLQLGNEVLEFKARFGGISREIYVPIDHVIAIYARENGQGMAFPVPTATEGAAATRPASSEPSVDRGLRLATTSSDEGRSEASGVVVPEATDPPPDAPSPGRPSLKRVK